MKKQYVGISRDHSGSMSGLTRAAMKDYNVTVASIKYAANQHDIDTIVSVVRCGIKGGVDREVVNSSVDRLKPLTSYEADGGTPLFDSVGELINLLSASPDASDHDVTFLVMAITDGGENQSTKWSGSALGNKMRELQASDKWTFVFRVPYGYAGTLTRLGIPAGNILEWEQTERGMHEATISNTTATLNYYDGVSRGIRNSDSFYANANKVKVSQVKKNLTDISRDVKIFAVGSKKAVIQPFIESKVKFLPIGAAFYQLTKPEKVVQSSKLIVIQDKTSGKTYAGDSARDLLGLPHTGSIKLSPGDHGNWDIFVQSRSTNRILMPFTKVLFWRDAVNY